MRVRYEVWPFIIISIFFGALLSLALMFAGVSFYCLWGGILAIILIAYLLYFFRDPEMTIPSEPNAVVAGASGVIAQISHVHEKRFLNCDTVRISIFLSLFDVHVNRAPIAGMAVFLGYFAGQHVFTFKEKSSDVNQHNSILITGQTRCLVRQIVGPVARRVVYFLDHKNPTTVSKGQRIGMMKFGSRLDMYFPANEISVLCKIGEVVVAGETIIGRLTGGSNA
ncbi:MAG: phosphatidylserine decarboxylase [bacterium]|nr:phosphatidylserine decarboxylase [bacterium]